jgi:uncharacterized membrane protein
MSKHRLELFSDAVMAIILTIMVLDLKAPAEGGWHAWVAVLPSIATYLLGFLSVTVAWLVHHQYFARFRIISYQMLWANFILLFGLSLTPLLIRTLADHPNDTADTLVYLIVNDFVPFCFIWLRFAAKRDHWDDPGFREWFKRRSKSLLVMLPSMAIAIALAFVSPITATIVWGAFLVLLVIQLRAESLTLADGAHENAGEKLPPNPQGDHSGC